MPLGKTAKFYASNPEARRVRLRQQARYDGGSKREHILSYHKELSKFRNRNKKKISAAKAKNGGKPVDISHNKRGTKITGIIDRSRNRSEPRTR